jgi:hypothetical protein
VGDTHFTDIRAEFVRLANAFAGLQVGEFENKLNYCLLYGKIVFEWVPMVCARL